jgi:peptidyl-dipeptidase A
MRYLSVLCLSAVLLFSCNGGGNNDVLQQEAQKFIDTYTTEYVKLYTNSSEAQWKAQIAIVEGDTTNTANAAKADEAMAAFTGSKDNIENAKKYLEQKEKLTEIQVKQLELILYAAANNPQTLAELVKQRIKAENEQTRMLYGYQYIYNGKKVSTNDLDAVLKTENDLNKRLAAWTASKEVGKTLKTGLVKLRDYRNQTVQALGYHDFFTYQVSDYGYKSDEMMQTMDRLMTELRPLYRELHTWMRYEMAKKYNQKDVPDYLPAHWLPNRWGQDWSSTVEVKGINEIKRMDSA